MRIVLLSDIHANLPALERALEEIDRVDPDLVYCLGDLVGYAPWPNEVVDLVRERRIPTIAGNYDVGVGNASDDCGCAYKSDEERERGARSIAWTNQAVTDRSRAWLRGLPRHLELAFGEGGGSPRILLVHGSPRRVNEYLFEDRSDASLLRMMEEKGCDIMAFGHTHRPYHRAIERDGVLLHAINTGSVGKPKDADPRGCFVLLELDQEGVAPRVEFVRFEYDVERAADAVIASGLPVAFAQALRNGR